MSRARDGEQRTRSEAGTRFGQLVCTPYELCGGAVLSADTRAAGSHPSYLLGRKQGRGIARVAGCECRRGSPRFV